MPFVDDQLAALDGLLRFDWLAYMHFFNDHAWLCPIFDIAYQSIVWQPVAIIVALATLHDQKGICVFLSALMIGMMLVCVIATVAPALGPYQHYGAMPSDHSHIALDDPQGWIQPILWLRAATFQAPCKTVIGLITFPSYHTIAAVTYVWAGWRVPILKWLVLTLNMIMLAAIPLEGSHYLVDILGGGSIACLLIVALRHALGMGTGWQLARFRGTATKAAPAPASAW